MRVGWGFDAHRFGGTGPLWLAGVVVSEKGLEGTSDADVLAHALADALLGAAALGDLGVLFPSSDSRWVDADSMDLLDQVVAAVAGAGFQPVQVDATVIAETVRVSPHRDDMRARLAASLGLPTSAVSVKATTTDGLGFLGRDEGVAAMVVAVIEPV